MEEELERLPPTFDQQVELLEKFLHKEILKLLTEARSKNILKPPYGRKAGPSPLISEEDYVRSGAWKNDNVEDECAFQYEYGFNPLQYLGQFIQWSHPSSVLARRKAKENALIGLRKIAAHGMKQLDTVQDLQDTTVLLRSGIVWGPFTGPLSPTSVIVVCQPLRQGVLNVQLSFDPNFETIVFEKEVPHSPLIVPEVMPITGPPYPTEFIPAKLTLSGLRQGSQYFIRCCMRDALPPPPPEKVEEPTSALKKRTSVLVSKPLVLDSPESKEPSSPDPDLVLKFRGVEEGCFQTGQFWTLPQPEVPHPHSTHSHQDDLSLYSHSRGYNPNDSTLDSQGPPEGTPDNFLPVTLVGLGIHQTFPHARPGVSSSLAELRRKSPECFGVTTGSSLIPAGSSLFSCLVGDIFSDSVDGAALPSNPFSKEELKLRQKVIAHYRSQTQRFYRTHSLFAPRDHVLRSSSVIFGWSDSREGSNNELKEEESRYKQYKYDLKKYEKKVEKQKRGRRGANLQPPPTLERLPRTPTYQSILEALPTEGVEEGTRHMFRSFACGPDIQVFVLDVRKGFIGKHQSKWLREELGSCGATWKIVLCGSPFGLRDAGGQSQDGESLVGEGEKLGDAEPDQANKEGDEDGEGKAEKEPNNKEEEKDEDGRPISSLHYVIASIQKMAEKTMKNKIKKENDVLGEAVSGGVTERSKGSPTARSVGAAGLSRIQDYPDSLVGGSEIQMDGEDFPEDADVSPSPAFIEHTIESGIILLTGGLDQPYVATYDPRNWGNSHFCCEVNVGSSVIPDSHHSHYPDRTLEPFPYSVPNLLYMANPNLTSQNPLSKLNTEEPSPYFCVLSTVSPTSLSLKIARPASWHSVEGQGDGPEDDFSSLCGDSERVLFETIFTVPKVESEEENEEFL